MPPTFAQLGVPKSICHALARRGITKPFEIQRAAMPDALSGRDICGHAPTGSGKTLAFGIPLVANAGKARPYRPQALVLAPTRELSHQIMTELRSLSGKIRVTVVYGGVGYGPQIGALRRGVHILVACPGRLEDLIDQRAVDLSDVEQVVVDEADRMADMGFIPAVRRLLDQTSSRRQTMLFSATLDGPVKSLIRDYQNDPARHRVSAATPDVVAADHVFWTVARTDRLKVTAETIDAAGSTIVFSRTRHGCDRIVRQLDRNGVRAAAIHGKRSQSQRTRALEDFASERSKRWSQPTLLREGYMWRMSGLSSTSTFPPTIRLTSIDQAGPLAPAPAASWFRSFLPIRSEISGRSNDNSASSSGSLGWTSGPSNRLRMRHPILNPARWSTIRQVVNIGTPNNAVGHGGTPAGTSIGKDLAITNGHHPRVRRSTRLPNRTEYAEFSK